MSEKCWKERPTCNIIPECNKPAMVVIAGRNCCANHLISWHNKQEEKLLQEFID